MDSIHGHEVLRFMLDHGRGFSRESLVAAIENRFGPDARFHTCSASALDAAGLVDFLEARGKFTLHDDGGFQTAPDRICSHE